MAFLNDAQVRFNRVTESVDYFDEYGFAVFNDETANCDDRCHQYRKDFGRIGSEKEWTKVFRKWIRYKNGLGVKVLHLVKRGVPDEIRPKLWKKLLDVDILRTSLPQFSYQEEVSQLRDHLTSLNITEYNTERAEQELARVEFEFQKSMTTVVIGHPSLQNLRQILLDVARTFPTHILFFGDSPEAIDGRASLFRILAVYARFNPVVGYCQGMSFIAGMLLMVLSEEDAFWCLVALLQKPKYLHGYFDATLARVQRHALIFDHLLKQRQPDLWKHLHGNDVDPLMYITPWLMCLFTSLPCWDVVLGIWDLILLQGVTVIFRVALAIMDALKDTFMAEKDGNCLILVLQRPPAESVARDALMPVIWRTNVDLWELRSIQDLIDEADSREEETVDKRRPKSLSWSRVRHKMMAPKTKNEKSFLSKIAKMFNSKSPRPTPVFSTVPEIVITAPTPSKHEENDKENIANRRHPPLSKTKASEGGGMPLKSVPVSSEMSNSTSENLHRIRRLVSGKRHQSQSTESLGKGVDSVARCGATHSHAFSEFSNQVPLRKNQRSCTSILSGMNQSPEKELHSLTAASRFSSSPVSIDSSFSEKRRRRSVATPPSSLSMLVDENAHVTPTAIIKTRHLRGRDGICRFRKHRNSPQKKRNLNETAVVS